MKTRRAACMLFGPPCRFNRASAPARWNIQAGTRCGETCREDGHGEAGERTEYERVLSLSRSILLWYQNTDKNLSTPLCREKYARARARYFLAVNPTLHGV